MTPFWIEYSLYDECQRHIYPLLYENTSRVVLTLRQRMNLSAVAGKASTRAKGPTPETHSARKPRLHLQKSSTTKKYVYRLITDYGCIICVLASWIKRLSMRNLCASWHGPLVTRRRWQPGCVFSVYPCIFGASLCRA